jgi:toxin HigB-1
MVTFACAETERIFRGERSRRLSPDIQNTARRKLEYLHRARRLDDLRMSPGNWLEALAGDRKGQHSIRVNDQWRICFVGTTVMRGRLRSLTIIE